MMFMPTTNESKSTSLLLIMAVGVILSDVYIQPTQGLKCYECIIDCTKPRFATACKEEEVQCVTTFMEDGRISRLCVREEVVKQWADVGITCETYGSPPQGNGDKLKACFCNTDLCNTHEDIFKATVKPTTIIIAALDNHAAIITISKAQLLLNILASFFAYHLVILQ